MEKEPARVPIDTLDDGPTLPPPPPVPPDAGLEEQVVAVLQGVYDPEIPVNVHELGLVYAINVDAEKNVVIRMTLTSPACPVAGSLPPEVEAKVKALPGVASAKVELVWDPPWTPDRMSEAARLQLGLF
jgi:FeS assembly SUF system protein